MSRDRALACSVTPATPSAPELALDTRNRTRSRYSVCSMILARSNWARERTGDDWRAPNAGTGASTSIRWSAAASAPTWLARPLAVASAFGTCSRSRLSRPATMSCTRSRSSAARRTMAPNGPSSTVAVPSDEAEGTPPARPEAARPYRCRSAAASTRAAGERPPRHTPLCDHQSAPYQRKRQPQPKSGKIAQNKCGDVTRLSADRKSIEPPHRTSVPRNIC